MSVAILKSEVTIKIGGLVDTRPPNTVYSLYSNQWTDDRLARQKSWMFAGMKDFGSSDGLPDQMQMLENKWIPLTQTLQLWYADVLSLSWRGKLYNQLNTTIKDADGLTEKKRFKIEWAGLMRNGLCFTNHAGWDKPTYRADYIQQINLQNEPMGWEPLLLAGNTLEVIGDPVYISNNYLGLGVHSYRHLPVRCLDARKPLPNPVDFLKDKNVCHDATTIKPTGIPGRFPWFDNKTKYPIWSIAGKLFVWDKLVA